jgi:hypothetical protein
MFAASEGGPLLPRLQFGTDKVGVAYVEIYDAPENVELTLKFEVASTPQGPAVATVDAQVGSEGNTRTAIGPFSPAGLPPGDYLVRAILSIDGKPAGQVTRTLRKAGG